MADASGVGVGGGSGWEVVSLTASTYAAAPGPVPPLLPDSHEKADLSPPADAAAMFMSQHFNLPSDALLTDLKGPREEEESSPAMVDGDAAGTEDLNMQNDCQTEMQDDSLTGSEFLGDGNGLQEGGGLVGSAVEERLSTILCPPDAAGSDIRATIHHRAATDAIAVDSASPPAAHVVVPAVSVSSGAAPVAENKGPPSKIPCEAHAWWNKTFSFLRSNSKQSLTFRFVFVAATIAGLAFPGQRDRLQLRLEFNVDSEKMSCAVRDPLGQVKLNMLVGGSSVAQGN